MAKKLSVKGMTVCTPEFHEVAKRGEIEYAKQAEIDAIVERIHDLDELSESQAHQLVSALGF